MPPKWTVVLVLFVILAGILLVLTRPQPVTGLSEEEHQSDNYICVSGCLERTENCCDLETTSDSL